MKDNWQQTLHQFHYQMVITRIGTLARYPLRPSTDIYPKSFSTPLRAEERIPSVQTPHPRDPRKLSLNNSEQARIRFKTRFSYVGSHARTEFTERVSGSPTLWDNESVMHTRGGTDYVQALKRSLKIAVSREMATESPTPMPRHSSFRDSDILTDYPNFQKRPSQKLHLSIPETPRRKQSQDQLKAHCSLNLEAEIEHDDAEFEYLPTPKTFLDEEGGTPVSASLNNSIAQRRRHGEYFHRPPIWNIYRIGKNESLGSDTDLEFGLNSNLVERTKSSGSRQNSCQFCLARLPSTEPTPHQSLENDPFSAGMSPRQNLRRAGSQQATGYPIRQFNTTPSRYCQASPAADIDSVAGRPQPPVYMSKAVEATSGPPHSFSSVKHWTKRFDMVTLMLSRLKSSFQRHRVSEPNSYSTNARKERSKSSMLEFPLEDFHK
ncbi:hypothetical protein FQN57_003495 [Myotisia sp. PD_48]|nr:hypothetical protein FQN57_003495 [Myotisia sp. PD_48]